MVIIILITIIYHLKILAADETYNKACVLAQVHVLGPFAVIYKLASKPLVYVPFGVHYTVSKGLVVRTTSIIWTTNVLHVDELPFVSCTF